MLKFKIEGQIITRLDDTKVVADSIDYLTASFKFPSEWNGIKTAVFRKGRATYSVVIAGDDCIVPWEVLEHSTSFTVSAFCGTRITSNTVHIPVIPSGYAKGDTPKPPTPDVYTQLTEEIDGIKETAQMAVDTAGTALTIAEGLSNDISLVSDKADEAIDKADKALIVTQDLEATANNAVSIAESAISKLSSVYKYKGSFETFDLLTLDTDLLRNAKVGYVWNIAEACTMQPQFSITGKETQINAGDNIAVVEEATDVIAPKFDVLAGTIDLSGYATLDVVDKKIAEEAMVNANIYAEKSNVYTKTEIDSKVSSVYRYKGSVDGFNHLPSKPSVGDVYNVKNSYSKTAHGVNVTQVADSGYGSYPEDEYVYLYLSSGLGFDIGKTIEVFDENKISLGEFVVKEKSGNTVSEQIITNGGLYDVCVNIAQNATGSGDIFGMTIDINKMYYFTNVTATGYSIEVPSINAGDNVAWTGNGWDVLAGTTDLSAYATKDYVDTIIGVALEGEY